MSGPSGNFTRTRRKRPSLAKWIDQHRPSLPRLRAVKWVVLGLLAVALAAEGGWTIYRRMQPRVLRLCIVTDLEYRTQHANAPDRLLARMVEVNRIFEGTGISWKAEYAGEAYPPGTETRMDERRAMLQETASCKADVILGFTGRQERQAASAPPFSHNALIAEGAETEPAATWITARTLAGLFGTPPDAAHAGTLMTMPPESANLGAANIKLIHTLRGYNFAAGLAALAAARKQAAAALTEALAGKQESPAAEAHRILSHAFTAAQKRVDATLEMQAATAQSPGNADLHFELGLALEADAHADEAINELREAIRLNPKDARPHAALGTIFGNARRIDESIDEFQQATRLSPNSAEYFAALGHVFSMELGHARDATSAYETALKLNPTSQAALLGLGRASGRSGMAQSSLQKAEEAAHTRPDQEQPHIEVALAQLRLGNLNAANAELVRALQINPKSGTAHLGLARLRYLQNDFAGAESEMNAARAAGISVPAGLVNSVNRKLRK